MLPEQPGRDVRGAGGPIHAGGQRRAGAEHRRSAGELRRQALLSECGRCRGEVSGAQLVHIRQLQAAPHLQVVRAHVARVHGRQSGGRRLAEARLLHKSVRGRKGPHTQHQPRRPLDVQGAANQIRRP